MKNKRKGFTLIELLVTIAILSIMMIIGFFSIKAMIEHSKNESNKEPEKMQFGTRRDLLEESTNIGDLKKYNMMLQNISLSNNVKNYLNNNRKK